MRRLNLTVGLLFTSDSLRERDMHIERSVCISCCAEEDGGYTAVQPWLGTLKPFNGLQTALVPVHLRRRDKGVFR